MGVHAEDADPSDNAGSIIVFPSPGCSGAGKFLHLRNDLRPDRNHSDEKHNRGQRSSFFNECLQHDRTPYRRSIDSMRT